MEGRKVLVLSTLAIFCVLFIIATLEHHNYQPMPPTTVGWRFPSFGEAKAPVEVVLIEDFQCPNCKALNQILLSKLQEQYIAEGTVRLTLVPVSFLEGSLALSNAALEVYEQNPKEFLAYLSDLFEEETPDPLRLAEKREGIDLEKLQRCIEKKCHYEELRMNLQWAKRVMGSQFRAPALYVNGAVGSTYSFEAVQYQIEEILKTL